MTGGLSTLAAVGVMPRSLRDASDHAQAIRTNHWSNASEGKPTCTQTPRASSPSKRKMRPSAVGMYPLTIMDVSGVCQAYACLRVIHPMTVPEMRTETARLSSSLWESGMSWSCTGMDGGPPCRQDRFAHPLLSAIVDSSACRKLVPTIKQPRPSGNESLRYSDTDRIYASLALRERARRLGFLPSGVRR